MSPLPNFPHATNLSKDYQSKIRRALLGGQKVQIASEDSILVGGNIHASEGSNIVIGNNNTINYSDVDAKQIIEFLRAEEQRIANDVYARALQGYLKDLNNYCDHLPYLGLYDPSVSLNKSYVPIKFAKGKQDKKNDAIFIEEVLQEKTPHVLILGEPGAGKSTILRQIAKYAWNEPEKIGLQEPYLPVLLPLRIFSTLHGSLHERIRLTLEKMDMLEKPFPDGFFTAWSENEQTKWLLLLDGLDEVATEERKYLIASLNDLVLKNSAVRAIITSRPSGYSDGELGHEQIAKYKALPFSAEQVQDFASNWFGEQAAGFIRALEKLNITALYETPLLLTIAARIYVERSQTNQASSLPERRADLYAEFVRIMLDEANSRGLSSEIEKGLAENSIYILAYLAWKMQNGFLHRSEEYLTREAAEYLKQSLNIGSDRAETLGRGFVLAIGRYGGIILKEGKIYNWLHPTFGEYLAAWYMVKKRVSIFDVFGVRNYDLQDYYRDEVILFATEILASQGKDITPWVNGLYKSRGTMGGGKALASLGKVETDLSNKIINELFLLARRDSREGSPIALLGKLCAHYPKASEALISLVYERDLMDEFVRYEAIALLGKAGDADKLLRLARDVQLYRYCREDAVMALVKIPNETDKAAQACLAIAQDKNFGMQNVDGRDVGSEQAIKVKVTQALGKLPGWDEVAASLLFDFVVKDENFYLYPCEKSIKTLGDMEKYEKLKAMVQNNNLYFKLRMKAMTEILNMELRRAGDSLLPFGDNGREEWLINLVRNDKENLRKRFWAALETIHYEDYYGRDYLHEIFFQVIKQSIIVAQALANSPETELFMREFASEMAKGWSNAIPELLKLIYDDANDVDERMRLVRLLALSEQMDDIFELSKNKQIDPRIRLGAAHLFLKDFPYTYMLIWHLCLENYEDPSQTSLSLWDVVYNMDNPIEVRLAAAQMLLVTTKISDLPELLEILQTPTDNPYLEEEIKKHLEEVSEYNLSILESASDFIVTQAGRVLLAEFVAHLGYVDAALKSLLLQSENEKLDGAIREQAIQMMGRIGDSRCLPDLEIIASQNQNEDLRKAASEAAEKIRGREKPQEQR
jgi:HEAT repeat protein